MAANGAALAHGSSYSSLATAYCRSSCCSRASELERAALLEVSAVRPAHPGYGDNANTSRDHCIPSQTLPAKG